MKPLQPFAARWSELNALLDEALNLPASERDAWLAGLQGEAAAHAEALRALLAHQAEVERGGFLETLPTLPPSPQLAGQGLAPGGKVGAYQLIEEIGRGGMGTVWLAERSDGLVRRRVALKLPRVAWGDTLAERLSREREILASLAHPHIARLYDAGVDAQGRPFFAMEYVQGQAIDRYCTEHALPLRERVRLLLQVMAAVAHAHARLVVHRDLKPGNILVAADGQARRVTLLDFGIAKLLDGERTQATALTELSGRALTLDYASPEQIRGEPLGTASDIYSLAVVAYEVLTGVRPYRLKRGSAAELEEAIASAEAPLASSVATDALQRKALRGDLDAILNRALKKAPGERYLTMEAFAQDLRHWLDGDPVEAQPDRFAYRTAKFVGRYRLQVAAGTAVTLALLVGASVALWQAHEARLQAERARAETATARAAQDFMVDVFGLSGGDVADPDRARSTTARELLDRGAQRVDTVLKQAPEAQLQMLATLATMYRSMALLERSAELQQKRLDVATAQFGASSRQTASAQAALARALALLDRRELAARMAGEAAQGLDRLGEGATLPRFDIAMAQALIGEREDLDAGQAAAEAAIANARARHDARDLVQALGLFAEIANDTGHPDQARDRAREALALVEASSAAGGNELSSLYVAVADAEFRLGNLDEAEINYRQALAVADERNSVAPIYRHAAARRYGNFLRRNGRPGAAMALLEPAYRWARTNPDGFGTMTPTLIIEYGRNLATWGHPEQALSVYDEAETLQQRIGQAPETIAALQLFRAQALADVGRWNAARDALAAARAGFATLPGGGSQPVASGMAALERLLLSRSGQAAQALNQWQAQRKAQKQPPVPGAAEAPRVQVEAARLYLEAGEFAIAGSLADAALQSLRASPQREWQKGLEAATAAIAGETLLHMSQPKEALDQLTHAMALGREVYDPQVCLGLAHLGRQLAQAQRAVGDATSARASEAEALRILERHPGVKEPQPLP